MIVVDHLAKSFGQHKAVNDISFGVEKGQNLILLGASGCGKTTTLKMINRLIEPGGGQIKIDGKDIRSKSPESLRRNIGYVLQHNSLFPHYTVAENIGIVPGLLKWDRKKIKARTEQLLHKMHLPATTYWNAYPHQLSGGQQQRVNVARALAADPPVLLMDEPFGALDPITRASIVKDFKQLDELKQKTIVMVTHDIQEAFEMGDSICVMDQGRIMQIGQPSDLLFHPANDYVKAFLEKQRLNLAFQTIKMNDIWDGLSTPGPQIDKGRFQMGSVEAGEAVAVGEEAPVAAPGSGLEISAKASIWDAMEILNARADAGGMTPLIIKNEKNEARKASLNDILIAYANFKNKAGTH